jgi:hypothetical protein
MELIVMVTFLHGVLILSGRMAGAVGSGANCGCRCIVNAASTCWKNIVAGGAQSCHHSSPAARCYIVVEIIHVALGSVELGNANGLGQRTSFST